MNNFDNKMVNIEDCPVRMVLDRIGDKWSMLVVLTLGQVEKLRFNELHKSIGDISQKMLTVTLRNLESDGIVNRTVFPEIPPRVEYNLTERGCSLLPLLANLTQWAEANMDAIRKSRNGKDVDFVFKKVV